MDWSSYFPAICKTLVNQFFPDTDLVLLKLFLCKPFSLTNRSTDKKADAWPDSVVWSPFGPVYELYVGPVLLVHSKSEFWSCTYPHKPDSKSQVPGAVNKSKYTRLSRMDLQCLRDFHNSPSLVEDMHCLAIAFTRYRDDLRISTHEKRWASSVNSLKERLPVFSQLESGHCPPLEARLSQRHGSVWWRISPVNLKIDHRISIKCMRSWWTS